MKQPIFFEVMGRGEAGKTWTACNAFPNVKLVDCTPHADGKVTAIKSFGKEFEQRYRCIHSLEEAQEIVNEVIDGGRFSTVVFDEYSTLRRLGGEWYKETFKKKTVFPVSEWGIINGKILGMMYELLEAGVNVVITSGFHAVYDTDGNKTGKIEPNSPSNADHDIDFRLLLTWEDGDDPMKGKTKRINLIVKNKFVEKRSRSLKTLSWDSIKKEIDFPEGLEYCE